MVWDFKFFWVLRSHIKCKTFLSDLDVIKASNIFIVAGSIGLVLVNLEASCFANFFALFLMQYLTKIRTKVIIFGHCFLLAGVFPLIRLIVR